MLSKTVMLGSLAFKRPREFWDRTLAILSVWLEPLWVWPGAYAPLGLEDALNEIKIILNRDLMDTFMEPQLMAIEQDVTRQIGDIESSVPFTLAHNVDFSMARCVYGICRALKPKTVVETGVAYGVTSAFILKALDVNGEGTLYSIDLPPLGRDADSFVGAVIPEELKKGWKLYRGVSKRVLPGLLTELSGVEIFLHDSLHHIW